MNNNLKIHHLGAVVQDMDRTLAFYCDVLGAELLWDTQTAQAGDQWDTIYGFTGTKVRTAGVRLHGVMVEFFNFTYPKVANDRGSTDFSTIGWKHIAFEVTDIEQEVERRKAGNVPLVFPIQTLPDGVRIVYFTDPDGLTLEYIQPA